MKTGIHIEPCKIANAEVHNSREPKYLERVAKSGKRTYTIFSDKSEENSVWLNPFYSGKSLPQIYDDICNLVKSKTGRKIQQKATPIREGVCSCREDTTAEDLAPVVKWYEEKGARVISIYVHHDEGYCDIEGERRYNHHAHIVVDMMDYDSGKSVKLSKDDICELQGVVADALGMERGTPKAITQARHLGPAEFREKKAREQLAAARKEADKAVLLARKAEFEAGRISDLSRENSMIKRALRLTTNFFFNLVRTLSIKQPKWMEEVEKLGVNDLTLGAWENVKESEMKDEAKKAPQPPKQRKLGR